MRISLRDSSLPRCLAVLTSVVFVCGVSACGSGGDRRVATSVPFGSASSDAASFELREYEDGTSAFCNAEECVPLGLTTAEVDSFPVSDEFFDALFLAALDATERLESGGRADVATCAATTLSIGATVAALAYGAVRLRARRVDRDSMRTAATSLYRALAMSAERLGVTAAAHRRQLDEVFVERVGTSDRARTVIEELAEVAVEVIHAGRPGHVDSGKILEQFIHTPGVRLVSEQRAAGQLISARVELLSGGVPATAPFDVSWRDAILVAKYVQARDAFAAASHEVQASRNVALSLFIDRQGESLLLFQRLTSVMAGLSAGLVTSIFDGACDERP